jgi:tRNA dimethylallyltransferase
LIVVAGPTAVGKTALCIELSRRLGCDIISADSRQFYKGLTVGTAKPSREELNAAKHHFIDVMPIEEEFSAGKFEVAALKLMDELFKDSDAALMTGGSGLYIQAVCKGMNEIPDVDLQFREELYKELSVHGLGPLVEELSIKDPEYWETVDRSNPQRIIRALEVCRGTGQPYSLFRTDTYMERNFTVIKIGLERERAELFERISTRVDKMMEAGLIDEAKLFYDSRHLNALKTVGYKEIFGYLNQEYDLYEAIRLLKRNSRRYAKRQLTWFKKDPDFQWFHPDDVDTIMKHIEETMAKN